MPFKLGPFELVIILIVFGVGKLPQVGAALGKSIRSFKEGQSGADEEDPKAKKPKKKKKVVKKPAAAEETPTSPVS